MIRVTLFFDSTVYDALITDE